MHLSSASVSSPSRYVGAWRVFALASSWAIVAGCGVADESKHARTTTAAGADSAPTLSTGESSATQGSGGTMGTGGSPGGFVTGCAERPRRQLAACRLDGALVVWTHGNVLSDSIPPWFEDWACSTPEGLGVRMCCSPDVPDFRLVLRMPGGIRPGTYMVGPGGVEGNFELVFDHARAPDMPDACVCAREPTRRNLPLTSGRVHVEAQGGTWSLRIEGAEPWVSSTMMDMTQSCALVFDPEGL